MPCPNLQHRRLRPRHTEPQQKRFPSVQRFRHVRPERHPPHPAFSSEVCACTAPPTRGSAEIGSERRLIVSHRMMQNEIPSRLDILPIFSSNPRLACAGARPPRQDGGTVKCRFRVVMAFTQKQFQSRETRNSHAGQLAKDTPIQLSNGTNVVMFMASLALSLQWFMFE